MVTLREIFAGPSDLLRLGPEELAGVLIEVIPSAIQHDKFVAQALLQALYPVQGGGWEGSDRPVILAIAEAMAWLISQGLLMRDPSQPGEWYLLTRRGRQLSSRIDVEAYRKGRELPLHLLQPILVEKVEYLFLRGDYDTAVFQAFKTLEVATREACGYDNNVHGVRVFTQAFHIENGPLRNQEATRDERGAEVNLFIGAFGHCRNPVSHREVDIRREEAARLIVFASHLLAIVEERSS